MSPWAKAGRWARLFSEYAGAQGLVQLLGVASGLWLVHLLPLRDYALYTLALSMLAFLGVFSDLGLSSALSFFRRETRIHASNFAPYVRAAFVLRRLLLALGAIATVGFMLAAGTSRGFGAAELFGAATVLVVSVWFQIDASMALLMLRLEGRYRQSYLAEVLGNASRLMGVAAIWAAALPFAWLALAMGAAGSFVTRVVGMRSSELSAAAAIPGVARGEAMSAMVRYVLPMSLGAIYFSIQSPLTVWLAAYFSGTHSIAEVGALGRLAVIFSLVSGFMGTILVPRLTAVTDEAHYRRRFLQCWGLLIPFGAALMTLVYLVPGVLLKLIGDAYAGLDQGLQIAAAAAVLSTWGGFLVAINNARGWVRAQPLALAIYAVAQGLLIASLDLSTTTGVLRFGLCSNVVGLALQAVISVAGFMGHKWPRTR